jgi:hypothetical protein
MISIIDAKNIALRHLANLEQAIAEPLELVDSATLEKPFGWIIFYNSKAYLDTGDIGSMRAGNAPFIVENNEGRLHETGTESPVEAYIDAFEKKWLNLK